MGLVNLTYGVLSNDLQFNMTLSQEGLLNIHSYLSKESSDYYAQLIVSFDDGNGTFSNALIDKTIEVCKFLSTPTYESLIQLYYKQMIKYENNLPVACPIGGNVSSHILCNFCWFFEI